LNFIIQSFWDGHVPCNSNTSPNNHIISWKRVFFFFFPLIISWNLNFLKHYHIALEIALKMLKDARNHQWQAFMFSPRWAVEYIPAQNAYDPWIMRPTIHLFQDSSYSFIVVVKFMNLHSVNHQVFQGFSIWYAIGKGDVRSLQKAWPTSLSLNNHI
jgi:hypothetical protein